MIFEMLWRNKWLCSDVMSIEDFAQNLKDAAEQIKALAESGVILDEQESDLHADHTYFITTDPKVAKQFGMQRRKR